MAQDYHIYIHGVGGSDDGSGGSEETKPYDERKAANVIANGIREVGNFEKFGSQLVNTGVAALTKVVPWVAIAIATYQVTSKVLTSGFESFSSVTGNYQYDIALNNFKTNMSSILNPVGVWRNTYKRDIEFHNINVQANEKRRLLNAIQIPNGKIGV